MLAFSQDQRERVKRPRIKINDVPKGPLFELQDDSIVLYKPSAEELFHFDTNPNGLLPVILNPELQVKEIENVQLSLREEQIDGLQTLWNSVARKKGHILAYDMGLGKTRIMVCLIHTLMTQSNNHHGTMKPAITKCVILAPTNVLQVWKDEFSKWAPSSSLTSLPTTNQHLTIVKLITGRKDAWNVLNDFDKGKTQILLLSYDTFKSYQLGFTGLKTTVGLLVCDEAHLLKNSDTQRFKAVNAFKVGNYI